MHRILPFEIPRIPANLVKRCNRLLDAAGIGIRGTSLPSVATLIGAKKVRIYLTGISTARSPEDRPYVPAALSLSPSADSAKLVLGLIPEAAARLIDGALARPPLTGASAARTIPALSQGEIGALIFALDRAGRDWIDFIGSRFTLRGFLEDVDQVSDYLGGAADMVLCGVLQIDEVLTPLRLWCIGDIVQTSKGAAARTKRRCTEDVLSWPVRIAVTTGWSTVPVDDAADLAAGDKIVLDAWNCPDKKGGFCAPLLWNGEWCRYGRFVAGAVIEITDELDREKTMELKQADEEARHRLEPVSELDGAKEMIVTVRVEAGRLNMSVEEALGLVPGRVVRLDRPVSPEVRVFVGDKLLGRGTLVDVDGCMAVEIEEVYGCEPA